jgi:sigma-B regulation protein RsbU (phosphoserine phosphatase)
MADMPLLDSAHPITVLLVDDQAIVGAAVRRMLEAESDIIFHHCQDPTKALETAKQVKPTVILQDLVMPEIDGLTLVKFFRANPGTKEVPLVVLSTKEEAATKAQAFALGANDYLVKLPDKLEVIARIRYHSKAYINLLERNEAYRKLADEVAQAERYVRSLLPEPLKGPIQADWKFIPSTQLGGDLFGYHWLDDEHFVMYLLDVCGHGVGAALLSVSARNVLSAQSLPNTDFRDPARVLKALNEAFPMEKHNNQYFTIWYGVWEKSKRRLRYSGGGHPPGLLRVGTEIKQLESQGPGVGMWGDFDYEAGECAVGSAAQLLLYSDGVYEIHRKEGGMWAYSDFVKFIQSQPPGQGSPIDALLTHVRQLQGNDSFEDDFSMVDFRFGA